jgi:16S rRNA processing protein RimM
VSLAELFQFGYVSKAHGLNGEVLIKTFDPNSTALDEVESIVARLKDGTERVLYLREVREGPAGEMLVSFKGYSKRIEVDVLRGSGVFVRRADLEAPEEGEFFQGDLVGLEVVTPEGAALGKVSELWNSGPVPNLVIVDGAGVELMIPFVDEFVKSVDLEKATIVALRPEYEGG